MPMSDNFDCGANFRAKNAKKKMYTVLNKTISDQPIFLIFNTQIGVALGFFFKFEENRTKITAMSVPHTKNAKWPPMTSSN